MADRIRFHLDEHVDPAVALALRRAGVDVTTTTEADLRTASDQDHLQFGIENSRVIVTRDPDFIRLAATGTHSLREVIEALILIHEVLTPEEKSGHVEYL